MFSVSLNTATISDFLAGSNNMESQCSNRVSAEKLYALQKLEEILHCKERETTSRQLESCSSQKNYSVVKKLKSPASNSSHKSIDGLRSVKAISKNVKITSAMKEEEKKMHRSMNAQKLLTDSIASRSNEIVDISRVNSSGKACNNFHKGKKVLHVRGVKQLQERLKILEEENETVKHEFFEQREEREKLMDEIYQQFRTIYHCLHLERQMNGERHWDGSLIINSHKIVAVKMLVVLKTERRNGYWPGRSSIPRFKSMRCQQEKVMRWYASNLRIEDKDLQPQRPICCWMPGFPGGLSISLSNKYYGLYFPSMVIPEKAEEP